MFDKEYVLINCLSEIAVLQAIILNLISIETIIITFITMKLWES